MDGFNLLHFLQSRERIVVLDFLYFWPFVGENRQNLGLLLRRQIKLLCYCFELGGFRLGRCCRCNEHKRAEAQSRRHQADVFLHIVSRFGGIVVKRRWQVKANRVGSIQERWS